MKPNLHCSLTGPYHVVFNVLDVNFPPYAYNLRGYRAVSPHMVSPVLLLLKSKLLYKVMLLNNHLMRVIAFSVIYY